MPNNDLISRDSVLKGIEELQRSPWYNAGKEPNRDFPYPHLEYIARKEAVEVIRNLCIKKESAVDAAPIVHAQWIEEPDRYYHWHCSACGFVEGIVSMSYHYRPNCGAKIGGESDAGQ